MAVNRKPGWSLIPGDWVTLQRIINELGWRTLGSDSALWGSSGSSTQLLHGGLILPNLSASQTVMTDINKKLISVDYLDQAVKTTSSPLFSGVTILASSTHAIFNVIGGTDYSVINCYSYYGASPYHGCYFVGNRARGTYIAPEDAVASDILFQLQGNLYQNGAYRPAAQLSFRAGGTVSDTSWPGTMLFQTVADGEVTMNTRAVLTNSGKFGVGFITEASVIEQIHSSAKVRADSIFNCNGSDGVSGSFTAGTKTVTVTGGIITAIV